MSETAAAMRLNRKDREKQILTAAARLVIEQGCLPLPMEALAARAGVSKALVYAYFPNQAEIARRLLSQHLADLAAATSAILTRPDATPGERALSCAEAYFQHVAAHGPLLHILLSDPISVAGLGAELRGRYAALMRPLARGLHAHFCVPREECVAALHILLSLPEETGNLVFRGRLRLDLGRRLARQLVDGALSDLGSRIRRGPARPAPTR